MLSITKILCPTDFSEPSLEAIKVANKFALHFGSNLYLLHVASLTPVLPGSSETKSVNVSAYQKKLEEAAKAKLQKVIDGLISKELGTCQPVVLSGSAADEILRFAHEEKVDMIVMSTYGLTGWGHVVYGSVAHRVVQLAPCPVLTIRPSHETLSPEEQKNAVEGVEKILL